ncbi:MAG: tetraacyldisaccharide 4'-kinase [Gemmatimonadaceae bacterium]
MPPNVSLVERVWTGQGTGRLLRVVLTPAEWLYRLAVSLRNALFDARLLAVQGTAIPAISVGNVTVGGTGKTPFASFVAWRLRDLGAHPAIILRGYGGDEPTVHAALLPDVPVVVSRDRVAGAARAAQRGSDVAVFDDAFQHRGARRVVDLVLVSADVPWATRCLPTGPLREPVSGLKRADLVIVTRKAALVAAALEVESRLRTLGVTAIAHATLQPEQLVDANDPAAAPLSLSELRDHAVLALAGIGNPSAFFAQLQPSGAREIQQVAFADHHAYSVADVQALVTRGAAADFIVCTLKDAVKLRELWPRSGPRLWYVSQRIDLVGGGDVFDAALRRLLAVRRTG